MKKSKNKNSIFRNGDLLRKYGCKKSEKQKSTCHNSDKCFKKNYRDAATYYEKNEVVRGGESYTSGVKKGAYTPPPWSVGPLALCGLVAIDLGEPAKITIAIVQVLFKQYAQCRKTCNPVNVFNVKSSCGNKFIPGVRFDSNHRLLTRV